MVPSIRPFNREDLARYLSRLPGQALAAFAASCAERMLQYYESFWIQESEGNPDALRSATDVVWDYSVRGMYDANEVEKKRAAAIAAQPDSNRVWDSVFAGNASDACEVVTSALEIVQTGLYDHAVSASIITQQALDQYLALVLLPAYGHITIEQHVAASQFDYTSLPMFISEMDKQEYDLETLMKEGCTTQSVAKIRSVGALGPRPVERLSLRPR